MARKSSKIKIEKLDSKKYLDRMSQEVQASQSRLSMILGVLIILVLGILFFNYFNRGKDNLGPAQNTQNTEQRQNDVALDQLPGNYTVKQDDTLFLIAEKYYKDGYKYNLIAQQNHLSDPNIIEVGQVLNIPKSSEAEAAAIAASPIPSDNPTSLAESLSSSAAITPSSQISQTDPSNFTEWGPKITTTTYTVIEGDWLSKIAERAYGNIMTYNKIALANNITNPNLIEAGTVLTIPR